MTEEQKATALATLEQRASIAERHGLKMTANSWRKYADAVRSKVAAEIVLTAESPFNTGTTSSLERT